MSDKQKQQQYLYHIVGKNRKNAGNVVSKLKEVQTFCSAVSDTLWQLTQQNEVIVVITVV